MIKEEKISAGEVIVDVNHLQKSFGENHVLKDINLKLHKGESIVVLGKSGCGKSVLIKCIVGLIRYNGGVLKVFGKDISLLQHHELDKLREKIGFVFQSSALYDSMTVRENLEFPLRRHKKKSRSEIDELVAQTLDSVGLKHAIDMMPSELSGGMRKRIGLARALILKPELILYDEPTTGLDPITAKEISSLMLKIQKEYNTSSITISHDMHCARLTANKMYVMIDGMFKEEGTFDELEKSENEEIKAFFEE